MELRWLFPCVPQGRQEPSGLMTLELAGVGWEGLRDAVTHTHTHTLHCNSTAIIMDT